MRFVNPPAVGQTLAIRSQDRSAGVRFVNPPAVGQTLAIRSQGRGAGAVGRLGAESCSLYRTAGVGWLVSPDCVRGYFHALPTGAGGGDGTFQMRFGFCF